MALVLKDRVKETTTTTGTGTYTLAGAVTGFEAFSSVGDGNTTYYSCTDGTDFEVGIGTYTASGTTLARTTILQSSNSDSAVSWSSGTKTIFCAQPAEKAVFFDASDNVKFADTKQAIFGDGDDLTIEHNGNNSFIRDAGQGDLYIRGNNNLFIQNADGTEHKAKFTTDGAVELYHDNSKKLETASGGISVTGEVAATSLDISGDVDVDGTLEADAITVNGTALSTVIAGTTVSNATLAATVTVADSTANTNFPVVFHDESNGLLDDTGALRYNPSTGELLAPKINVSGTDLFVSRNVDVDGTLEADAITVNGTALNTVIADEATALAIALG